LITKIFACHGEIDAARSYKQTFNEYLVKKGTEMAPGQENSHRKKVAFSLKTL
jgi:hypothetical protein